MRQTGIVKEVNLNTAKVEITRSSACGESCASCGLCPGKNTVVEAKNTIGAGAGDVVTIELNDQKVIGAAVLVYIVPLCMLVMGYFLGYAVFKSEGPGIICGFLLMAAVFPAIRLLDKKLKKKYTPQIIRTI